MQTGWVVYANYHHYYFKPSGEMATGWVFTNGHYQYLNEFGLREEGLKHIDGHWYLFYDGDMMTGLITGNGLQQLLFSTDGSLVNGIVYTYAYGYYFVDSNMEYQTGWQLFNGNWYYFGSDKLMHYGWLSYNGNWYYLDESGVMILNRSIEINGQVYYFDSFGIYQPA